MKYRVFEMVGNCKNYLTGELESYVDALYTSFAHTYKTGRDAEVETIYPYQ